MDRLLTWTLKRLKLPIIFSSYLQQPTLFFHLRVFFLFLVRLLFFFLLVFYLKVSIFLKKNSKILFERLKISLQLLRACEYHCIVLSPVVAENYYHLTALGEAALWHVWQPLQLPQLFQEVPVPPSANILGEVSTKWCGSGVRLLLVKGWDVFHSWFEKAPTASGQEVICFEDLHSLWVSAAVSLVL